MRHIYPAPIQSSVNGSTTNLDLFTGIFYLIRILGAGGGAIRPSVIPSANGGIYLEQDIFFDPQNNNESEFDHLWYFEPSSIPSFYEWGATSEPTARVAWASGDDETDDFPLQLRNMSEIVQDIYEDPSSTYWDFESFSLNDLGYSGFGYKVRPMNLGLQSSSSSNGPLSSVTFAPHPKSQMGWWLQLNNYNNQGHDGSSEDSDEESDSHVVTRSTADHLLVFEPQNFKLYARISHFDAGKLKEIMDTPRVKKYGGWNLLKNPSPNDTTQNVTFINQIQYDLYVRPDEKNLFSGITVLSRKTTPSSKYFDLEQEGSDYMETGVINLQATRYIQATEEIEMDPFSRTNVSSYVTYLKEFKGIKYFSWADVSAVVDMMGSNGHIVKNVLVKDVALLKHLIRARGYQGEFRDLPNTMGQEKDVTQIRIKTTGRVWGSFPIPFVQIEEGQTFLSHQYKEEYRRKIGQLNSLN
ncbi:uncharacterized protein LOC110844272 [Folsomia candida]|nr:uncharacterized protein LOC110844272 [Folsomia candida]